MKTSVFPGNYNSLRPISEFVLAEAGKLGATSKELYQIELAVDEAGANIIDHAYGGENLGDIEVSVDHDPGVLYINFTDHGKAFDPTTVADPDLESPLQDRSERGLGVYLIRKLMDEVAYDCTGIGPNRLSMVKYLGK